MALSSSVPSQSDGGSSSSLWRRSSAHLGHAKRASATYSSATLGEFDTTSPPPLPGSSTSPQPFTHLTQPSPPPLPTVPQTPQTPQGALPNAEPSSSSTSALGSHSPAPTAPVYQVPPLSSTPEPILPPPASDLSDDEGEDHDDNHGDNNGNGNGSVRLSNFSNDGSVSSTTLASVMTLTQTSPGSMLACLHSRRLVKWNRSCDCTWSGSSAST